MDSERVMSKVVISIHKRTGTVAKIKCGNSGELETNAGVYYGQYLACYYL